MNPYKKGTKEYEEQFKRDWEESMKEFRSKMSGLRKNFYLVNRDRSS